MSEQHTDEWHAERIGKLTASLFHRAVAETKTGWGAERENYMAELIVERLTGQPYPRFVSEPMQFGTDNEALGRRAYCFDRDVDVIECGFIPHPDIAMSGCSPDGLIGIDGLVEIKCPNSATHWKTRRTGNVKKEHIIQMMWQLACTRRDWCDYVSFDPRMPLEKQLFIRRFTYNDGMIEKLERQAREFLAELERSMADDDEYERQKAAA